MRILNRETLISHGNKAGREAVCDILDAGLDAGDPYHAAFKMLTLEGSTLTVNGPEYEPIHAPRTGPATYELGKDIDRIFLFGAGKGILRIAKALEDVLGDRLTGGCVIVKYGDKEDIKRLEIIHGAHPVPDENCVKGCKRIIEMTRELRLTERDLVFTAIGNGVGSLLTLPGEGIPLDAVKHLVHLMQIEKGVPTAQLSIVRNQVDQLKGGRITRLFRPAKMIHLLAIDCNYGNTGLPGYTGLMKANVWLHTMPDLGSRELAIKMLKNWDAWDAVDESIRAYLLSPSPAKDPLRQAEFEQMDSRIFGLMPDKLGPLPAAMKKARELGYTPHHINAGAESFSWKSILVRFPGFIVSFFVRLSVRLMFNKKTAAVENELEASAMGRSLGLLGMTAAREGKPLPAPCALFFTGEMLVTVGKGEGIGGRDQECALSAAGVIRGQNNIVIGAVDTDGTDGPGGHFDDDAAARGITTLAGGIVDGYTAACAAEKKVDIAGALKNHGSSAPLWKLDSGVWAAQNISVQDLAVVLVMPDAGSNSKHPSTLPSLAGKR